MLSYIPSLSTFSPPLSTNIYKGDIITLDYNVINVLHSTLIIFKLVQILRVQLYKGRALRRRVLYMKEIFQEESIMNVYLSLA